MLSKTGSFDEFLKFSNSIINLGDKWDINYMPHIKYLIVRCNFYANVNNYETISMRNSILKNLDTKTDEKYLNNFLEYAHETISNKELIWWLHLHIVYKKQLNLLYELVDPKVPSPTRNSKIFLELYSAFLPNDTYKYKNYGTNIEMFVDMRRLVQNTLEPTHQFIPYKYVNDTELSKYIWKLKDANTSYSLKWSVEKAATPYKYGTRKCDLCLREKVAIIRANPNGLLNKRTELISKCRHRNKFIIGNVK